MTSLPEVPSQERKLRLVDLSQCFLMLLLSVLGLWKWLDVHSTIDITETREFVEFLIYIVFPISLWIFLIIKIAQRYETSRVHTGYRVSVEQLQKRINDRLSFLHAITDHETEVMAIFDKNNNYWFVNNRAAQILKRDARDIVGMSPLQLLDHERAKQIIVRLDKVRHTSEPIDSLEKTKDDHGQIRHVQVCYKALPVLTDLTGGVMFRENDVTNLLVERERREIMFRQVLATLVAVIDRRDPFAAGHSARVGQLSRVIAEEMVVSEKEIEAAEVAGSLMNFGKVLVSRQLLTKTTALTAEELKLVRDSILTSADILSIIDFSGPVVPTLKQVLERYDGSGEPLGLKGEQILVTARIVTVANSYVALVSPRAHRPGLGLKDAIELMTKDVDKLYDRNVVRALAHFIDNRSNKLDWLMSTK